MLIDVNQIKENPFNPRMYYSEKSIKQLAESIKQHGLIHRILVRKNNAKFEIVTGHRRFRAIQMLGWKQIEADVKDLTDTQMLDIAVIENIQRQDLTNVEISNIITYYLKQGLTQEQVAEKLSKSQTWVSQAWILTELPNEIKNDVIRHLIPQSYAFEYSNFLQWYKTQLHPKMKGKEKEEFTRKMVKCLYISLLQDEQIKTVRKLRDVLETIKWNLMYSRAWVFDFEWYKHGNYEDEKFQEERHHHQNNIRWLRLKHAPLNEKEMVWSFKKSREWFPEEYE